MGFRVLYFLFLVLSAKNAFPLSELVPSQDLDFDNTASIFDPQDDGQSINNGFNSISEPMEVAANPNTPIACDPTENENNNSLNPSSQDTLDPTEDIASLTPVPGVIDYLQQGAQKLKRELQNLVYPAASDLESLKTNDAPSKHNGVCPQVLENPQRTSEENCGGLNPSKSCEIATAQIIYPKACGATTENESITKTLHQMVGGSSKVHISRDKTCGIFFWATKLKRSQIQRLQKLKSVHTIAPDGKIESYSKQTKSANVADGSEISTSKSRRLRKRDAVRSRSSSPQRDLAYISTPPGAKISERYTYFAEAGRTTTGYVLGDGLNPHNDEFLRNGGRSRGSVIKDWLFGLGADPTQSNQLEEDHETACYASKIAGEEEGVAPEADLVIVKVLIEISSYLDGIQKIIEHVEDRIQIYPQVKGHNVLLLSYGWNIGPSGRMDANQAALQWKLRKLMDADHQVVVVAAAGLANDQLSQVNSVPALFSLNSETPVITVGSINQFTGARPGASPIGNAIKIAAPYTASCASSTAGRSLVYMRGTGVSAAIVAGLVLNFMSLEANGVGDWLTRSPNVPATARRYLLRKAYRRNPQQQLAVWNGLSPIPGEGGTYGWEADKFEY